MMVSCASSLLAFWPDVRRQGPEFLWARELQRGVNVSGLTETGSWALAASP